MQHIFLGDLLVRRGVLTIEQRDAVLAAQRTRGGPFGALAEEMFGVHPTHVEAAWAEQYAGFVPTVDPRAMRIDPRALELVSRRQAWQFKILPVEVGSHQIVACTTQQHLVRALRFSGWHLGHACRFVLADPIKLGEALCQHYPMAGMTPQSVLQEFAAAS